MLEKLWIGEESLEQVLFRERTSVVKIKGRSSKCRFESKARRRVSP